MRELIACDNRESQKKWIDGKAIMNRAKRVNWKQSFHELQAFALRYGKIL